MRLGATSCTYPADIPANVERISGIVDDIELVLFEVDGYGSNLPSREEIARLQALAETHDLTYTVHLQTDLRLVSPDQGDPDISLEQARRIIHLTQELNPWAYIAHLDGEVLMNHPSAREILLWQDQARLALDRVCEWLETPEQLCLENIEAWNPDAFTPVVEALPISRCVDIGHLWLQKMDPLAHMSEWIDRTRVVHIHGLAAQDHNSLSHVQQEDLDPVVAFLGKRFQGVVTMEVFSGVDLLESLDAWSAALRRVD